MTLGQGVAHYLDTLSKSQAKSPATLAAYRRDLAGFLNHVGDKPLSEISRHDVRGWLAAGRSHDLAASTQARQLSALRSFAKYAQQHLGLEQDWLAGVRAPKGAKKLPRALSVDAASALLSNEVTTAIEQRDQAAWELLYGSGLRVSELLGLRLADLDLTARQARVTGKGDKTRLVPLTAISVQAIQRWLPLRPTADSPFLFCTAQGKALSVRQLQRRLKAIAIKTLGTQDVHPHQLRHAFATHMLEGSKDLRAVQELLGHANLSTTQVYTHLDFDHLAAAYDGAHPRAKRK